jgi:S1-C subfamily serine protease
VSEHEVSGGEPTPDAAYQRPPGVADSFAPHQPPPASRPPQPTPSAQDEAVFGRPEPDATFAPLPGHRIGPRRPVAPEVPHMLADAFSAPPGTTEAFAPAPGTRIPPGVGLLIPTPSPQDLWHDDDMRHWLGSPAVYPNGHPVQLPPEQDTETPEPAPLPDTAADGDAGGTVVRLRRRTLVLLPVVALLLATIGGAVGYWLGKGTDGALHRGNVSLAKTGTPANRPPGSVADIARRVSPAVVLISVTTSSEFAVGSGVVIDKDGDVLTNNHVVSAAAHGAGKVVVTFSDQATATARIVGLDPISDLAVLKVPTSKLTVASLGDSDKLAVGDPVIAIGSPLALQGTVTSGIVSALHRAVSLTDDAGNVTHLSAIQTDAAINFGNSGGALVDASGAVVGINYAGDFAFTDASGRTTSVSGIGFAIPMNYARTIATELIRTGKAVHASLGAQGRSVTTADGLRQGAYLEQVISGGAAAKAGLKDADVIVAVGGVAILNYDELAVAIDQHKPGDSVAVTYYRGAAKRTASVVLSSA